MRPPRLAFISVIPVDTVEDIKLNSQVFHWPEHISSVFEVCEKRLNSKREHAEEELKKHVISFEEKLNEYHREIETFRKKEVRFPISTGFCLTVSSCLCRFVLLFVSVCCLDCVKCVLMSVLFCSLVCVIVSSCLCHCLIMFVLLCSHVCVIVFSCLCDCLLIFESFFAADESRGDEEQRRLARDLDHQPRRRSL